MDVEIVCNDGQKYHIDSDDPIYENTISRIIRQCGGWAMVQRYGEYGHCIIPCHIVTGIRCNSENPEVRNEFDKIYKLLIN